MSRKPLRLFWKAARREQVIGLLNAYKESLEQKVEQSGLDSSVEDALDAAEGGPSPVQLPGRVPVGDEDEHVAWDAM